MSIIVEAKRDWLVICRTFTFTLSSDKITSQQVTGV